MHWLRYLAGGQDNENSPPLRESGKLGEACALAGLGHEDVAARHDVDGEDLVGVLAEHEALAVERDDEHVGVVLDQGERVGRLLRAVVQLDGAGREVEAAAHAGGEDDEDRRYDYSPLHAGSGGCSPNVESSTRVNCRFRPARLSTGKGNVLAASIG